MKLESYIKPVPWFLSWYTKLHGAKGFVFGKWIFFRPEIYKDLLSNKPSETNIGYLIHERVHHKRKEEIGIIMWSIKYMFVKKFRFEEELAGYGEQMKYLKSRGIKHDYERIAQVLNSWVYWWCADYKTAEERLRKIWDES